MRDWTSLGAASPRGCKKVPRSVLLVVSRILATDGHHTVGAGAVWKTRRGETAGQICPPQIRQQRNQLLEQ
jgi:hypothetical protein